MLLIWSQGWYSVSECGVKSSGEASKNSQLVKGQVGSQENETLAARSKKEKS